MRNAYTTCEPDAPKDSAVEYDSLELDAQLAKLITDSWENARSRDENYQGYGNLSVLTELPVPWAPYARIKHEHSIREDGLQVPLNSEVSKEKAAWLRNGNKTVGTIVNRA